MSSSERESSSRPEGVEDVAAQLARALGEAVEEGGRLHADVRGQGQLRAGDECEDDAGLGKLLLRVLGVAGEVEVGMAFEHLPRFLHERAGVGDETPRLFELVAMDGADGVGGRPYHLARDFDGPLAELVLLPELVQRARGYLVEPSLHVHFR